MALGHKDPSSLVAEIEMTRMSNRDACLVLEGPSDARFWAAPRRAVCELIIGEGKKNVVGCIQRLDERSVEGVLGIIDDDYDSLKGISYGSLNLIATEFHDLECLLWRSSALNTVLVEYGDNSKIQQLERASGIDVRTNLLNRAMMFGQLRCAAEMFQLDIDYTAINVPRFVDRESWTVDVDAPLAAVVRKSTVIDQESLSLHISKLPPADPWVVVRGHDVTHILCIGLANALGSNRRAVGRDEISRLLRASIPLSELRSTKLWYDICDWQTRNSGFSIVVP